MPNYVGNKVGLLKINVRLEKLADFVHSRNEMLNEDQIVEIDDFEIETKLQLKNNTEDHQDSVHEEYMDIDSAEEAYKTTVFSSPTNPPIIKFI